MTAFLTGPSLVWLPKVFFWAVFVLATCAYVVRKRQEDPDFLKKFSRRLVKITIAFYFTYAAILTLGQYYLWLQNPFSRLLLNAPLEGSVPLPEVLRDSGVFSGKLGYFLFYSYGRFWLNPVIVILVALAFYAFLRSLKRHQGRFFEEGEVELGFLTALAAGWPGVVVFIPLVFLGVVLASVLRLIVFKERFTTLGWPFLAALFVALLFGSMLIGVLGLKVLYI